MDKKTRTGSFNLAWIFGLLVGVGGTMLVYGLIAQAENPQEKIGDVEAKARSYVRNNFFTPEMNVDAHISGARKEVYELTVEFGGESTTTYVTKDGTLFFPTGFEITDSPANNGQTEVEGVVKSDKPKVELFVMSYCPYGLQAEKGLIPAVELLGENIDFQLRFVDYAMHGEKELAENTRQYCIQKTQPEKLLGYLTCFSESADSVDCGEKNELNEAMIDVCVKEADDEYNIAQNFLNESTWANGRYPLYEVDGFLNEKYGVRGSPTLVINGEIVNPGSRSTNGFMSSICEAFNNPPAACGEQTNVVSPGAGFGRGSTTATDSVVCG